MKPERIFQPVKWNLLLLFSDLFILIESIEKLNLDRDSTALLNSNFGLLSVTVVLSNLISYIPVVLVLEPPIPQNSVKNNTDIIFLFMFMAEQPPARSNNYDRLYQPSLFLIFWVLFTLLSVVFSPIALTLWFFRRLIIRT